MIGIHRLENIDSSFSYFLERPFGNIIIYADEVHHVYSDLITSKGGLAHMFFSHCKKATQTHQKYFSLYGSDGVAIDETKNQEDTIPIRIFGQNYTDPQITKRVYKDNHVLEISQKGKKLTILNKDFHLTASKEIILEQKDITADLYLFLKQYKIDNIYFTNTFKQSFVNINS